MRIKLAVACALTAVLAVSGGVAEATGLIHTSNIAQGAVTLNRLSPNVQKQIMLKRIPGPAGVQGETGYGIGIPGANGKDGTTGTNGAPGLKGDPGTNGTNGTNGAPGLKGDPGTPGAQGNQGNPGAEGAKGPKGDTGLRGETGLTGSKGDKGDKGDDYMAGAYYSVAFYDVGDTNAGAIATVACKSVTDTAISGGVQVLGLDADANGRNTPVSSSFPGRMDWSTNTPRPNRLDGWIVQFGGNAGATSDKDPAKTKIWALCVPGLNVPVVATYTQSS
jgi:hypothetical protein